MDEFLRSIRTLKCRYRKIYRAQISQYKEKIESLDSAMYLKTACEKNYYRGCYERQMKTYSDMLEPYEDKKLKVSREWLAKEIELVKTLPDVDAVEVSEPALLIKTKVLKFKVEVGILNAAPLWIYIYPKNEKMMCHIAPNYKGHIQWTGGYFHPHVYLHGPICLGAHTWDVFRSISLGSLYAPVITTLEVLKYPSNESPVVHYTEWPRFDYKTLEPLKV